MRITAALGLCILLAAAGCKGRYDTHEASEEEIRLVSEAVSSYFDGLRDMPESEKADAPAWLVEVESASVVKVEKVDGAFKALVELRTRGGVRVEYFLIRKENGRCRLVGVI